MGRFIGLTPGIWAKCPQANIGDGKRLQAAIGDRTKLVKLLSIRLKAKIPGGGIRTAARAVDKGARSRVCRRRMTQPATVAATVRSSVAGGVAARSSKRAATTW